LKKIAVINVGGEEFGLDIARVVEILRAQRIYHLPQLPSFFSGVINIRQDVIPLVDLRLRFGLSSSSRKERVVVVRLGSEKVGLLVDAVEEIITLQPGEESGPPSLVKGLKAEYLDGLAQKGERIIILLNIDSVLTSEEKLQIGQIRKEPPAAAADKETAVGT
jgi:purine-binding chemotaxis protein CheW